MAGKIILSADSACDLSSELKERCGIQYYPFQITLGERHYMDGVDIFPDDLYRAWREERLLPKTAAVGVGEYMDYFSGWVAQGYEVIHLTPKLPGGGQGAGARLPGGFGQPVFRHRLASAGGL